MQTDTTSDSDPAPGTGTRATQAIPEWISWAPTRASYNELTARLTSADLQLCELQAHMDELIEANVRLRAELSEMTLQWVIEKCRQPESALPD
jgi:hypothetical protein